MKVSGWLGTVGGLIAFWLIHDEMAALLFWTGLGILIHAFSPWKELPLWELFLAAKRPFSISCAVILSGIFIFLAAHSVQKWFVRELFEPLGVLLVVLAIASLVAGALTWMAKR